VVYYEVPASGGDNCFLQAAANASNTAPALGIDVAILKAIAVGIDSQDPDGTSTESAPFNGETATMGAYEMSSAIACMQGNRTS
jgi:hypothetical protein